MPSEFYDVFEAGSGSVTEMILVNEKYDENTQPSGKLHSLIVLQCMHYQTIKTKCFDTLFQAYVPTVNLVLTYPNKPPFENVQTRHG